VIDKSKSGSKKAEGNALFAEEILSFLTERGVLRTKDGNLEFDAGAVGAALPASVQSLLTARVDRLAPQDRAVLQAAAVIGRRFDPQLLAVAVDVGGDVDARLAVLVPKNPKIPGLPKGTGPSQPGRGERNFWMQRPVAKTGRRDRKCRGRPKVRNDSGGIPTETATFDSAWKSAV
jgi:hypothetical protein